MTDHLRTLHEIAATRLSCYPNAGLPNEEGAYLRRRNRWLASSSASSIAAAEHRRGCCGTTPRTFAPSPR